jgi:histidinol-phosphate/aromatic aminotransferase/cobyric acid decarboxylase-like protein
MVRFRLTIPLGIDSAASSELYSIPIGMEGAICRLATDEDRAVIYALRHEVYARELRQHPENEARQLSDALDRDNVYMVVTTAIGAPASRRLDRRRPGGDSVISRETLAVHPTGRRHSDRASLGWMAGFISITPPSAGLYSIDKYLRRDQIPFALDDRTYEIRILTVVPEHRGGIAAALLMYAALRWVEAHGGVRIIAIGRREVRDIYLKAGLHPYGDEFRSGSVDFVLMSGLVADIRARIDAALLSRIEQGSAWELPVPFHKPAECFHGGAFFEAIGDGFEHLDRSASVINADVLDAWFPPSPRVIGALSEYLPWLLRTSPPVGCEGMIRNIARARGVRSDCILPGAGSSALIYLAFRDWLTRRSRVLLPDPTYGEYAHVLEKVIRCRVDRVMLPRHDHYRLDPERLRCSGYDLIVLVNPNSPTGGHVRRDELEAFLRTVPSTTLVWIDETYVDYAGAEQSLEQFAVTRENVVVCKSMSKVYALSGARCAYLCASPHLLEKLRSITPPWAVSLPGQVAAVAALRDPGYYAARHRETHALRAVLGGSLSLLDLEVMPSTANFLLCHLADGQSAKEVAARCRQRGLFIRDTSTMGVSNAIRIAVKDQRTNERMAEILERALQASNVERPVPTRPGDTIFSFLS